MNDRYVESRTIQCNLNEEFFKQSSPKVSPSNYSVYAPDPEELSNEILDKLEQSGRVPSKDKFRRMACNTFIYTGACPYNDRCVFLHDYRVRADGVKSRTTRPTKVSNLIKDTFYWPDMSHREIISNLDAQGLADVNQRYQIPEGFGKVNSNIHNRSIYSLWSHFVAFCMYNRSLKASYNSMQSEQYFQDSHDKNNRWIKGLKRLPVFCQLSDALHVDQHYAAQLDSEYDELDPGTWHDQVTPIKSYTMPQSQFVYRTPNEAPALIGPPSNKTDPASYMKSSIDIFDPITPVTQQRAYLGQASTDSLSVVGSTDPTIAWNHRSTPRHSYMKEEIVQIVPPTAPNRDDWFNSLLEDSESMEVVEAVNEEEKDGDDCEPPLWQDTLETLDVSWKPKHLNVEELKLDMHKLDAMDLSSAMSSLTAAESLSPKHVHSGMQSGFHTPSRHVNRLPSVDERYETLLGDFSNSSEKNTFHRLKDWFPEASSMTSSSSSSISASRFDKTVPKMKSDDSSTSEKLSFDRDMAILQLKLESKLGPLAPSGQVNVVRSNTLKERDNNLNIRSPMSLPVQSGTQRSAVPLRSQSLDCYHSQGQQQRFNGRADREYLPHSQPFVSGLNQNFQSFVRDPRMSDVGIRISPSSSASSASSASFASVGGGYIIQPPPSNDMQQVLFGFDPVTGRGGVVNGGGYNPQSQAGTYARQQQQQQEMLGRYYTDSGPY